MASTSTTVHLSSDFFLRKFYDTNRTVFKTSVRSDYSSDELSYADSKALSRATGKLSKSDYTTDEKIKELAGMVDAYVTTYNNTISSTSESSDSNQSRQVKQLKKLTAKYEEELKKVGISIEKDGSLRFKKDSITEDDLKDLEQIFSKDSEYMKKSKSYAKRINATAEALLYSQITGSGTQINIIL